MSKWLKILGIGSAIGVVTYGIIKYKQDQKFKEKVDEVAESIKNTSEKIIINTADFTARHPVIAATGFFGILTLCHIMRNYQSELARQEYYSKYGNDEIDPDDPVNDAYEYDKQARGNDELRYQLEQILTDPDNYLIVPKNEYEKYQSAYEEKTEPVEHSSIIFDNWKEEYRDTWDKVHELSNQITLAPGESYMIEEPRQLGLNTDRHIISHLIYGEGCYPPEIKDDQFIS